MTNNALTTLAERLIRAEIASDFARLRACPSTYTRKCIDAFSRLKDEEREELLRVFAEAALFLFDPERPRRLWVDLMQNPHYKRYIDGLTLMYGRRYMDVRTLHSTATDPRSSSRPGHASDRALESIHRRRRIRPAKAAEIRRAVNERFGACLDTQAENAGGGVWRYRGTSRGLGFVTEIDYGSRIAQLRYSVSYSDAETDLHPVHLTMERMLGFGLGDWNLLTADNLGESIDLLCAWVTELVEIPSLLATGSASGPA